MQNQQDACHLVLVLPSRLTFRAQAGETVFEAARRSGIDWPTRCLGRASCRQCFFELDEANARGVSEIGRLERDALKRVIIEPLPGLRPRLACQARVLADIEIHRAGIHRSSAEDDRPQQPIE